MTTTLPSPVETSMSLEDAIKEYIRIDGREQELYQEKKRVLAILLPAAMEVRRPDSSTTRLTSSDQARQIKVQFGSVYRCDVDRLNTVKELLGDDVFESLFKVEYSAKLSTLKPFLASKSTDEAIETAKAIIKEAITTAPKSPQVQIEKGRIEI